MSRSGNAYIARTKGHNYTLYAACRALGIPLSPEQEEYQAYLERTYPAEVLPGEYVEEETNDCTG